ncbi:MAG: tyrosine-type recombinase/integrase, partial [Ignavibacteriae bacterium]|nr:tyrosine-type recombinase/integrase [Ignavibacteriota bacterium]
ARSQQREIVPKSLNDLYKQYLLYSKTIHKPSTTRGIEQSFKFFKEFIGNPKINDITTAKLNDYIQYRISNHSIYQARKDLINLRRFFHKLEIDEFIQINPCRKIQGVRIPDKSPIFFTKEEFSKLIEIVKEDDMKDLYIFAVNTGLRLDEIRYLKKDNINSRNLTLNNHSNLTKTDKVRSVPLNSTAYSIILKRLSYDRNYLFTYRGFMLSKRTATQKLKIYTTELGFNRKLNFHSFRHTFASWLVQ